MTRKIEPKSNILIINLTSRINNKHQRTYKKGFSLLELLVVILILGILAATVIPRLAGVGDKAKVDLMCVNMRGVAEVVNRFQLDTGMYPETEEGFGALLSNPDSDKYLGYALAAYLKKLPKDSWRTPMIYIKAGNSFDIISYGADRKEGGTEYSADIKYSACE